MVNAAVRIGNATSGWETILVQEKLGGPRWGAAPRGGPREIWTSSSGHVTTGATLWMVSVWT